MAALSSGSSTLSDYRMSIYVTQASVGTLSASHASIADTAGVGRRRTASDQSNLDEDIEDENLTAGKSVFSDSPFGASN